MNHNVAEVMRFACTTVGAGLALAGAVMCCTPAQQQRLQDARSVAERACADLAKYGALLPVAPAAPAADAGVDAAGE